MSTPVVGGRPPTPEQQTTVDEAAKYWRNVANDAAVQAVARVEDAAKQIVALTGTLQGLYLAIIAFSSLQQRVTSVTALLFLLPVLFWLLSMLCATRVFVPRVRNTDLGDISPGAWQRLRDAYATVVDDKLAWLQRAHLLLVVSFVAVLALLVALVFLPAAPAAGPAQVVPLTPTPLAAPTP